MIASANVETWVWINWSIEFHHKKLTGLIADLERKISTSTDLMKSDLWSVEVSAIKEFINLRQKQQSFSVINFRAKYQRILTGLYVQYQRTNPEVIPPPDVDFHSAVKPRVSHRQAEVKTAEVKTRHGLYSQQPEAKVKKSTTGSFESDIQRAIAASLQDNESRRRSESMKAMFQSHLIGDSYFSAYCPTKEQRTITYQLAKPTNRPDFKTPTINTDGTKRAVRTADQGNMRRPTLTVESRDKSYAAAAARLSRSRHHRSRGNPRRKWRPVK